MFKTLLLAAVIVLACLGLAELIHLIKMTVLRPASNVKTFLVIRLTGKETAKQLDYVGKQTAWLGKSFAEYVIAAYDGLSVEETAVCAEAAKKYDMIYCPAQLVGHVIDTLG